LYEKILAMTVKLMFLPILLVSLLAGCAGATVSNSISPQRLSEKGVVIFSVSHDESGGSVTDAIFYLDSENIVNRGVFKSRYGIADALMPVAAGSDFSNRRGHLYIIELDPGSHHFDSWQVECRGVRTYPRQAPPELAFEVQKGQATYIGNLHALLKVAKVGLFGLDEVVDTIPTVTDKQSEDIPLAIKKVPALAGMIQVHLLPLGIWSSAPGTTRTIDPLPILPKFK
jgi:hypothetical protein